MTEKISDRCEVCTESFTEPESISNERSIRRNYKQIYRKEWESNPVFKDWLSSVSCDKHKAVCIACNKELIAHRLTLLKHASSAKHLKKLEVLNKTNVLLKSQSNGNDYKTTLNTNNESSHDDPLGELVDLEDVTMTTLDDIKGEKSLNSVDETFSSGMAPAETRPITFEKAVDNVQQKLTQEKSYNCPRINTETATKNLGLLIHAEAYIDISDSAEAINFKPGYVAENSSAGAKTNTSVLSCAAAFLNDKMNDGIEENVLNKIITTYPLQVSTRVTDFSRGVSVSTMNVTLYKLSSGKWMCVAESVTDEIGRCNFFPKSESYFTMGCYKLHYDVATYYETQNNKSYFPFIEIFFLIRSPNESHHIPLMISPNGYTVYRSLDF